MKQNRSARKKEASQTGMPAGFRQTGTILYEGEPVELWIHRKNGQLAFVRQGKLIEDPDECSILMAHLQKVNQPQE